VIKVDKGGDVSVHLAPKATFKNSRHDFKKHILEKIVRIIKGQWCQTLHLYDQQSFHNFSKKMWN